MYVTFHTVAILCMILLTLAYFVKTKKRSLSFLTLCLLLSPALIHVLYLVATIGESLGYAAALHGAFLIDLLWLPCFYFFSLRHLCVRAGFQYPDLLHTLPALGFVVLSAWQLWISKELTVQENPESLTSYTPLLVITKAAILLQLVVYQFLLLRVTRQRHQHLKMLHPNSNNQLSESVCHFIVGSLIVMPAIGIFTCLYPLALHYVLFIPFATGLLGLYFAYQIIDLQLYTLQVRQQMYSLQQEGHGQLPETLSRHLSETKQSQQLADLNQKLRSFMETEKPWLDVDLKIETLAAKLGTNSNSLSRAIHREHGKNFTDFVNTYRVEHAKRMLAENASKRHTIESVGNQSGFKTRSVFYQAFKKNTGVTPNVFLKERDRGGS